jgi:hypothetical protein
MSDIGIFFTGIAVSSLCFIFFLATVIELRRVGRASERDDPESG